MNQILTVVLCLVLFAGCKKDKPENRLKGTYKGQFIDGPMNKLVSVDSEIKFEGNRYTSNSIGGDFKVESSSVVKLHMDNIELIDYVGNKILHGDYNYEIKGDSLILIKIFPPIEYQASSLLMSYKNEYRLKRIK